MKFTVDAQVCKADDPEHARFAKGFTQDFDTFIRAREVDLHADIDLQLAQLLRRDFPDMVIDTSKHPDIETDTGEGELVY